MGFLGLIFGLLSILTAAMGVIVAFKAVPDIGEVGWAFWFAGTMILLLGSLACNISGPRE